MILDPHTMSKKGTIEVFQTKISRNDRFAQMSHQEKLIEQKKREIQAKLEQKQKVAAQEKTSNGTASKNNKSAIKPQEKKAFNFNTFSNDGTFLNQFKQLKDKKTEQKLKSFKSRENHDRYSDDRNKNKWKRDNQLKDNRLPKVRTTRFSDKPSNFETKINISTCYSNLISQPNFDGQSMVTAQDVTGQPLLKNLVTPQNMQYPMSPQNPTPVIAAPPLLLSVPPPQIQLQNAIQGPVVLPPSTIEMTVGVDLCPTTMITTVTLPHQAPLPSQNHTLVTSETSIITVPPPCLPNLELASIPPPNPIQVHNIPQPEPINTLTIPPPAPLQVQNIPPPSPIQLNEIPNPKPLDIMSIPTPNDSGIEKNISDHDFLKNIPPPNKSVPPPNLPEPNINISIPPPPTNTSNQVPTCLPPPNIMPPTSMPPPPQNMPPPQPQPIHQNLLVPPPQTVNLTPTIVNPQPLPPPQNLLNSTLQQLQLQLQNLPPPTQQNQSVLQNIQPQTLSISLPMTIQNTIPVLQQTQVSVSNSIPPLMAQPIMPPPGMGIVPPPPLNMNCPPPLLQNPPNTLQVPPPGFLNQSMPTQMMSMNVPPPQTSINVGPPGTMQSIKDMNTGSADYEAMASLGRMVAQCGPGIEEFVRQRKNQDPSLWFLFHNESAAYQQYRQIIDQFKAEMCMESRNDDYRPEDLYEPESIDDDSESERQKRDEERRSKRKRKSRWGNKEEIPPPVMGMATRPSNPSKGPGFTGAITLSKITRTDPGLVQYAVNTFGSTNLTEEDWKKAEDHYKINVLYQDMLRKRQEVEKLNQSGQNKYEYDSDEDIDGGTWEHKIREKEMVATQMWANELTRQAEGKHHIGDFLPPEEFKKFMEKSQAAKEGRQLDISDYKEFKLKEDNIGFKMLQKLGWAEGTGLGTEGKGMLEPVNKGNIRDSNQGLGLDQPSNVDTNDDEYDAYRKRMMLAYRFRPNPLNNPRRPYY